MIDPQYKYLLEKYSEKEIANMLGGHLVEEGGIAGGTTSGGGQIAGLGSTSPDKPANFAEPGISRKKQKKHKDEIFRRAPPQTLAENPEYKMGKYAGNETFIVPGDMFLNARQEKKKRKHWKSYIGEGEHGMAIREYNRKHRGKKPIILQCERTGALCYAQYGKR
jgi:hypothetical protein